MASFTFDFINQSNIAAGTAVEFRIYGWNASGSGNLRLDNIAITGTVTSVPEPSVYALLGGIASLALVCARRVHSRRSHAVEKASVSG